MCRISKKKKGAVVVRIGMTMMMRAACVILIAAACPVTALGRKGQNDPWMESNSEDSAVSVGRLGRKMQQSCPVCPSNAGQICASMGASEKSSASRTLVSACGAGNFQPDACCGLRGDSQWDSMVACACAGQDAQAARYVNLDTVGTICGCGGASRSIPPPIRFDQEMLPLIG